MSPTQGATLTERQSKARWANYAWAVIAAFGIYFATYGLRRPFTSATEADYSVSYWGFDLKTLSVTIQLLGYVASKFIGIRVIAELPKHYRGVGLIVLLVGAWLSLLVWAVVPTPWNLGGMFINGLLLGMIFGLVMGFLEGRRVSEALLAGLCVSFIVADGVMKSVGTWLLGRGVDVFWMPFVAGTLFLPVAIASLGLLVRTPAPNTDDEQTRSSREPMGATERKQMLVRLRWGLVFLLLAYVLTTMMRSIRNDYAPEIWLGLGYAARPALFSISESIVGIAVMVVSSLSIMIGDNRKAFLASIMLSVLGLCVVLAAIWLRSDKSLTGFWLMVLVGFGLYLPYVAVHTTLFERLIAMTRVRGNIGFLMYLADASGYAGYVGLLWFKSVQPKESLTVSHYFQWIAWLATGSIVLLIASWLYFRNRARVGDFSLGATD